MNIKIIKILSITLLLFIILDLLIGKNFYKKFIRKSFVDVDTNILLPDETNDHVFKKNYKTDTAGWGPRRYSLCTDENGFRISCFKNQKTGKIFDIGIIGDSFTEAVGIEYEDSFVGKIDLALKEKRIANLAISSYSPTIYYTKIKKLLKDGYYFKEIIIFLDLSDVHDDNVCYIIKNNKVTKKTDGKSDCYYENYNFSEKLSAFSLNRLRLTYELFSIVNTFLINTGVKEKKVKNWVINNPRSNWTFNYDETLFNNLKREEVLKNSENLMIELYKILNQNNIKLSVAVFPWPGTLKYENSINLHTTFWRKFCENRCKQFMNLQEPFFNIKDKSSFKKTYFTYFIEGDVHFNEKGNDLMADNFLKLFRE